MFFGVKGSHLSVRPRDVSLHQKTFPTVQELCQPNIGCNKLCLLEFDLSCYHNLRGC